MDYINPEHRRLRDEPTLPLSPEEAAIAANLYQEQVLKTLFSFANKTLALPSNSNTTTHEEAPRNPSRFN
jgi:hypothetical protein